MKTTIRIYKIVVLLLISILTTWQAHCQTEVICEEIKFLCQGSKATEVIIKDEQSYKAFQNIHKYNHPVSSCSDYKYPEIDFENFVLVGYIDMVGGCHSPSYSYRAIQEDNTVTIHVEIIRYGTCKVGHIVRFWLLIPKSSSDMEVIFEHTVTYN